MSDGPYRRKCGYNTRTWYLEGPDFSVLLPVAANAYLVLERLNEQHTEIERLRAERDKNKAFWYSEVNKWEGEVERLRAAVDEAALRLGEQIERGAKAGEGLRRAGELLATAKAYDGYVQRDWRARVEQWRREYLEGGNDKE